MSGVLSTFLILFCPYTYTSCVARSQIDDEADVYGIDFVKISDSMVAKEHNVYSTPALVYFRKKMPVA